jgi:hypothetical protein
MLVRERDHRNFERDGMIARRDPARSAAPTGVRPAPADTTDSRAASNDLLAQLHNDRWRLRAWIRFLARACRRSHQQALSRPQALVEATALHGALLAVGRRPWTLISWALTVTHLGLLGRRRTLGAANALTLVRANLPSIAAPPNRWLGVIALVTDLLDGRLARRGHAETLFGAHADSLADAAFWLWFAARYEPSQDPSPPAPGAALLAVKAARVGNWDDIVRTGGWDVGTRPPWRSESKPLARFGGSDEV